MIPTIPVEGLDEIRRVWAGRGGILAGVAAVEDDTGVEWSHDLARARASRVLIEVMRPHLLSWPSSAREWIDALPAQSARKRLVADAPGAGVDWLATRLAGWPPREFHHRRRTRVADTVLVTATRWAIEEAAHAIAAVDGLGSAIVGDEVHERVSVAVDLLEREPLASAHVAVPSRPDLVALRSAGRPWGSVAGAAEWLRVLNHDPLRLAELPIDPDPAFPDRLFHVAVLGLLLRGLRAANWTVEVIGLPGGGKAGPKFRVTDLDGAPWDLWYEAGGVWTHYGVNSPFTAAVAGITGTGGPLGADVALVRPGDRAVVIEVKYSDKPSYVGRNGYEQCLAYMAEALSGLVSKVVGVVVGPAEIVTSVGATTTSIGRVVVTDPAALADVVIEAIEHVQPTSVFP